MPLSPYPGRLLERGVWAAPWMGPDGATVLLAVTSDHHLLVPPSVILLDANPYPAYDALWALLDARDPPSAQTDAAARRRHLRVV